MTQQQNKNTSPRLVNLGCRLNSQESETMGHLSSQAGLTNTIIINTCSVTAEAERQSRQTIRRERKENPDAYLIVTGCAVQLHSKSFAAMPEIDRILGNDIKLDPESFAPDYPYRVNVGPLKARPLKVPLSALRTTKARAFIQVQNGCNHRCTFCSVVQTRGPSRSLSPEDVLAQAQVFLDQGVQELILTGVDLTAYGVDSFPIYTLGKLVEFLLQKLPNLRRLRLSSIDSIEMDDHLVELFLSEPRLLPHIHFSLQSGSNRILNTMKRRHTRENAIALCQYLKQHRPELTLGADFIVGFPGETSQDFEDTLELVVLCELTHLHVFPYSRRPGTPAAHLSGAVSPAVIKERAAQLRALGASQKKKHLEGYLGKTIRFLTENTTRGHTDDFSTVICLTPQLPHQTLEKQVVRTTGEALYVD